MKVIYVVLFHKFRITCFKFIKTHFIAICIFCFLDFLIYIRMILN